MVSDLGSLVNMIWGGGHGGGPWLLNEHKNVDFDKGYDNHMSSI